MLAYWASDMHCVTATTGYRQLQPASQRPAFFLRWDPPAKTLPSLALRGTTKRPPQQRRSPAL